VQEACHRLGEKDTFIVLNPFLKRVHCTLQQQQAPITAADKGGEGEKEKAGGGDGAAQGKEQQQQERTYDSIQVPPPSTFIHVVPI
jgi:hypothetical protein